MNRVILPRLSRASLPPVPPPRAVIALCELALFAVPFSIVQYAPTFFFGALLVSQEWQGCSHIAVSMMCCCPWLALPWRGRRTYRRAYQAAHMPT